MYCPWCGKEIDDESDQCEFCGSPIKIKARNKKISTNVLIIIAIAGLIGILILLSPLITMLIAMFTVPVYEMNESVSHQYIGQISNGVWYANATVSIGGHMNYLAMETTWYDSSGNVIEKNLAWTKTNLLSGHDYSINTTYDLNTSPSQVKLVFFDNPSEIGNENDSNDQMELSPGCAAWP